MPRPKKNPITDPDGTRAAEKARGSQPAQTGKNSDEMRDRIKAHFQKVTEVASNVGDAAKTVGDTFQTVSNAVGTVGNAAQNVASSVGLGKTESSRYELKTHDAYGGLSLPVFNPGEHLATDLFTVSSSLIKTKKADADLKVEAIEEQRQTLRVVSANLDLNTDVLKAGSKSEKMLQAGIDYGTSKVGTDTKLIQFNEALVNNEIAYTKLAQSETKLTHELVTLDALRNETDQRRRYWQAKYQLGESRIKDVQMAVLKLDAKIGAIDVDASVIE